MESLASSHKIKKQTTRNNHQQKATIELSFNPALFIILAHAHGASASSGLRGRTLTEDDNQIETFTTTNIPDHIVLDGDELPPFLEPVEGRVKKQDAAGIKIPYNTACELGSAVDFKTKKCSSNAIAFRDLKPCPESDGNEACFEVNPKVF